MKDFLLQRRAGTRGRRQSGISGTTGQRRAASRDADAGAGQSLSVDPRHRRGGLYELSGVTNPSYKSTELGPAL